MISVKENNLARLADLDACLRELADIHIRFGTDCFACKVIWPCYTNRIVNDARIAFDEIVHG